MRKFFFALLLFTAVVANAQNANDSTFSAKTLEEIVVTSTRSSNQSLSTKEIDKQNLQTQNTGQNLPFLLSTTPSLVVTSDDGLGMGYTYFRIRGTDHTRINMTINGVPLNDSESQTVFWVNMTDFASSLQNVQVQRGVGTSTNGSSAFGASVNMLTDNVAEKPYAALHFNGGMYRTFREMIKVGTGLMPSGFAFDARFSKVNSDGYLERAKSDLYSYSVSGGWYGKKTMVKLLAFGGKEKTYMAWDGITMEQFAENPRFNPAGKYKDDNGETQFYDNQTDNYAQQNFQLHFAHIFNDKWNINAALHYTHGEGYYEQYKTKAKYKKFGLKDYYVNNNNDTIFAADLESSGLTRTYTDDWGGTYYGSDFVYRKNLDNNFYGVVASANYKNRSLSVFFGGAASNYVGDHFGNIIFARNYPFPIPIDYEYYRNTGKKFDANVYLKANYKFLKMFSVFADLQYRRVNYSIDGINADGLQPIPVSEKFKFFNPKIGLNFNKNGHNADFSFAVANREPKRDNYTEAGIHDIPKPETLFDYELGYSFSHKIFTVGANLYFMQYKNQLVLTGKYSDTGKALTQNVEKSYRAGVEFVGGVEFAKWLRWDVNLTLSQNKILNYADWVDDWTSGDQIEVNYGQTDISFSPNITFGSLLHFSLKGVFADFQTIGVSRQFLDNTQNVGAMLKPYCVNNFVVGYNVGARLIAPLRAITFKLQINNIFNAKYISNGWAYSYFESADAAGNYLPANQKYD
ncbi:MAG: TonB-dependent receptor, partial [Prevotellaceae bacterium]|nr:TonB-dependent receptor [Prevotellaceae bacterium]